MKNLGKKLEEKIKQAALEQHVDFTRLRDAGFMRAEKSEHKRFTPRNICDCILFKNGVILFAEIKRRNDRLAFAEIPQLKDLRAKWKPDEGVFSGVICELAGHLFFISTADLDRMQAVTNKKSFNASDAHQFGYSVPMIIPAGKRTARPNIRAILNAVSERWSNAA